MGAMDVIVIAIVATALVVGWFFATRHVPERAASHDDDVVAGRTTSDDLYGGADRPAGPDAEATDPDILGGDQSPPNSGSAR